MDKEAENLLQTFWSSDTFTWDRSKELKELIASAVERNDQEILCAFISRAWDWPASFPEGPSRDWLLLSMEVIIPALSKNVTEEALTSICLALRDFNGTIDEYVDSALGLLKKNGSLSGKPLCKLVAAGKKSINGTNISASTWYKAVRLLQTLNYKEATTSIVEGMFNRWENVARLDDEMEIAVKAIIALDAAEIESALEQLLSHPNPSFRNSAAKTIGKIGNARAVEPLKKRLGGLFNKPESVSSVRENIKKAIQNIQTRGK